MLVVVVGEWLGFFERLTDRVPSPSAWRSWRPTVSRFTVFAATFASLGSLRIRVTTVGTDTTFGRVIALVEQAEANRADVARIAR